MAAKKPYEEPFEETQALYKQAITRAELSHVNIRILSDNRAKDLFKIKKTNKEHNYCTDEDIMIILNEKIFEQLTPEQQVMVVDESIAGLVYNEEKEMVEIKKADVVTYSGMLHKYTFAVWNVLRESIKTLYQVEKDEEQMKKDQTEKAKKQKSY